jgi:hypothetical protein
MNDDSKQGDGDTAAPAPDNAGTPPAAAARSEAYRERFRQSQIIAAQVARARTAGGQPSEDEAARLVAEFHARGRQVTVCPPPDTAPAGEQDRGTPPKRSST